MYIVAVYNTIVSDLYSLTLFDIKPALTGYLLCLKVMFNYKI